ncbi:MAG: hypothetical protein AAF939_15610 [Planctomycetota bacterium]
MTEVKNPFADENFEPELVRTELYSYTPDDTKPKGLTAIAVICLALGFLGVLGAGAMIAWSLLQKWMSAFFYSLVEQQPDNAELVFQFLMIQAAQKDAWIYAITFLFSLVVSLLLLSGGFAVLTKSGWASSGRKLLRMGLVAGILNSLISLMVGVYSQFSIQARLSGLIDNYQGNVTVEKLQSMSEASTLMGYGSLLFTTVVTLGFCIFFGVAFFYLGTEPVRKYYQSR